MSNSTSEQVLIIGTEICFTVVGVVENEFSEPADPDEIRATESRIILDPELVDALHGMEPGQRLLVLFNFHQSDRGPLQQHPRGDENRPKRGVYMLRTPYRPNRIGASEVELTRIQENILVVRGLDALDGSPVLDLKPA